MKYKIGDLVTALFGHNVYEVTYVRDSTVDVVWVGIIANGVFLRGYVNTKFSHVSILEVFLYKSKEIEKRIKRNLPSWF